MAGIRFQNITATARSEVRNVFVLSNSGFVGSNPTWVVNVCPRSVFPVLPCVDDGLARADHPSKDFCRLSVRFKISELILNENRDSNPSRKQKKITVEKCFLMRSQK